MGFISYYFISKEFKDFEIDEKKYRLEFYEHQKNIIHREVDSVIDLIDFKILNRKNQSIEQMQQEISQWINFIRFGEQENYYVFVYDNVNLQGKEDFARMRINPNREDLVGKYISSEYEDPTGKRFREEFLEDIRERGESYTTYVYKKPGDEGDMRLKLSYFRYYPEWNWIVAAGVYLDDIDKTIEHRRELLDKRAKKELSTSLAIVFIIFTFAIVFSYFLSEKIKSYFEAYKKRIRQKTEAIEEFNKNLEQRVQEEIEKNREKEEMLIHKARLISLGEMISNIAHQWRQPLSQMSSILMTLKMKHKLKKLDDAYIEKKVKEADALMEYMSSTIDVFRNFFSPNKQRTLFQVDESVENALSIVRSSLAHNSIELTVDIAQNLCVEGVEGEFEQVVLNLLSNAKDSLVANHTHNPKIGIYAQEIEGFAHIEISDNGSGIDATIKDKIFDPFFSTKEESQSSGIGLYMSKLIVEKNLNGKLRVKNQQGAVFMITIPLQRESPSLG